MSANDLQLILGAFGDAELKCVIALKAAGLSFSLRKSPLPNSTPKLLVSNTTTLTTANSIVRYVSSVSGALAFDDLSVDDWIEWEQFVLCPAVNKGDKEAMATTIIDKVKTGNTFLVGAAFTAADAVVAVTLRTALKLLPKEKYPLEVARAYAEFVFQQPTVVAANAYMASNGGCPAPPNKKKMTKTVLTEPMIHGKTYDHVLGLVESLFDDAIQAAFPGVMSELDIPLVVARTANPKHGDYQCNSAMAIFTGLKGTSGAPASPREVALAIVAAMPANPVIEKISVAGPGFINAFLCTPFVLSRLETLLAHGLKASPVKKMKIVIDFSSPNTAKDMHVGHLRSTIIGDAMCRILEFQGHDVLRINHIGDWGTQFGMLICHLMDAYPTWRKEMPNVTDLTQLYKDAKKRFDEEEVFQKRSKEEVVKLQSGNQESLDVWKTICEISRREYQKVYDRLDVRLQEMGESFYNPIIPKVIDMLDKAGITEISNGAKVVFTEKYKQPFILVKSDGGYLYDTTDIAALWYRLHEQKADWIIIYTDYAQQDHFGLLFEVGKMAKILDPIKHRVNHIGFGTVNDESGKRFKTRSGETVRLVDLLDESKVRMKKSLLERIEAGQTSLPLTDVDAAAERIGYGALKYFDLSQSPVSNYIFSYDKMLSTTGNTAVYLLFAYARLASIVRKSGVDMAALIKQPNVLQLGDTHESSLAIELLQFQDVLTFINKDLMSNRLCSYLYNVSEKVQAFVTQCRVLGSPEQNSRLLLCQATMHIMSTCFKLLGIEPLEQI
jgi:arginyl-tRNA synthetase